MLNHSALALLDRDLRVETEKLLKQKYNVVDCPVGNSIEDSIKTALQQISDATSCSGLYIWSIEGNAGRMVDGWRARSALFTRVTQENNIEQVIKTEDNLQAVWFELTPLSYQWQVSSDEVKGATGGFTLYIGKRGKQSIKARLREHCIGSAQTGALKLAGNTIKPSRLDSDEKRAFFEQFRKADLAIVDGMGISRIVCDIIKLDDLEEGEIVYWEAILRTALIPMMGRR